MDTGPAITIHHEALERLIAARAAEDGVAPDAIGVGAFGGELRSEELVAFVYAAADAGVFSLSAELPRGTIVAYAVGSDDVLLGLRGEPWADGQVTTPLYELDGLGLDRTGWASPLVVAEAVALALGTLAPLYRRASAGGAR